MSALIGTFPAYLAQVTDLLNKASIASRVDIVLDAPDHGSLHNYQLHREYVEAVKSAAARSAVVRLVLPVRWKLVSQANPDYLIGEAYDLLRQTRGFAKFFWGWTLEREAVVDNPSLCIRYYMLHVAGELLDQNVAIKFAQRPEDMNPFFWRVDTEAIYVSITHLGTPAEAHLTSEQFTLDQLSESFDRFWQCGTPFGREDLKVYADYLFD